MIVVQFCNSTSDPYLRSPLEPLCFCPYPRFFIQFVLPADARCCEYWWGNIRFATGLYAVRVSRGCWKHRYAGLWKTHRDIVLRSPDYVHLYEPRTIDRSWMDMAAAHPDVEGVDPFLSCCRDGKTRNEIQFVPPRLLTVPFEQ